MKHISTISHLLIVITVKKFTIRNYNIVANELFSVILEKKINWKKFTRSPRMCKKIFSKLAWHKTYFKSTFFSYKNLIFQPDKSFANIFIEINSKILRKCVNVSRSSYIKKPDKIQNFQVVTEAARTRQTSTRVKRYVPCQLLCAPTWNWAISINATQRPMAYQSLDRIRRRRTPWNEHAIFCVSIWPNETTSKRRCTNEMWELWFWRRRRVY